MIPMDRFEETLAGNYNTLDTVESVKLIQITQWLSLQTEDYGGI